MLTELLHRAASRAAVYDAIQLVAGAAPLLEKRLAENLGHLPPRPTILDVGGGTGLPPSLWPEGTTYVCLDIDSLKLAGFVGKNVSHHLTDEQLPRLFGESARVLKRGGRMLFIDAVLAPERFRSRLLWRYDRGSHPRTSEVLKEAMAKELKIQKWDDFAHHFRYVFLAGVKQ